jgi:hypothetical protein
MALLDVTEALELPLDVAVIPRALRRALARELLRRPVALHQHGYEHVSHETEGRTCEFGVSRSAAAVRVDLVHGRALLEDLLGDAVQPIFTPPWNRCSADTGCELARLGWVLSRESRAEQLDVPGLHELPIDVDWHAKRRGVFLTRDEVGAQIAAALAGGGPVGLLFHHAAMDDDERREASRLLALLARHPAVRPVAMAELLGEVIPCASS